MAKRNSSVGKYKYWITAAVVVIALIALVIVNNSSSDRDFVIEDGVITEYNGSRKSVTLPKSASSVASFVFMGHTEIEKLVIGGNINTIGEGAFYGCTALKDLKIASTVAYINDGAFGECTALKSFTVPKECVYLNSGAFYGDTGIEEFKVEKGNTVFAAVDGVLYLNDMSAIVVYPLAKSGTEYVVPDGVTYVASWCFFGAESLERVVMPETVTEIGKEAFSCSGIKAVAIPDSVGTIGAAAFSMCLQLSDVSFGSGVAELPSSCFEGSAAITSVTIPENIICFQPGCLGSCGLGRVTFEGDMMLAYPESFGNNPDLVLCAAEGSHVQDYAQGCGYEFEAIG